jgi:hypothetical protein
MVGHQWPSECERLFYFECGPPSDQPRPKLNAVALNRVLIDKEPLLP